MVEIVIPKQLQNSDFRFLLLRPKDKKPIPEMSKWQEINFEYNNPVLLEHIMKGNNYAIIGGYGNLILIDCDDPTITKLCEENLPETFTIKTGSPEAYKKHFFFIADKKIKPIRLTKEKVGDLGDVRSVGQYVVAPNCLHPKGGIYKVEKDIPIMKITEEKILNVFKDYLEKDYSNEFKEYPLDTKLRATPYIRECRMPDYLLNKEMPKGNTAKNWKLFRYIVDILNNRQVKQEVYQGIARKQKHSDGAIKGWVMKAKEGKLGKSSCKLMREYINNYYPELKEEICGECPLYKKIKKKEREIAKAKNELQKKVFHCLVAKDYNEATELIVKKIEEEFYIYTTKDDNKSEMWIYNEGIYQPNGKSFIKEYCRSILAHAHSAYLVNLVINKIEADTFIEQEEFFSNNYIEEIPVENGILNVVSLELSDFTPEKIFFNKLPVEYDPDAKCPSIENFLKDILATKEDITVAYELIGSGLYKEYFTEKAAMFVGGGRNGKSKFLSLIRKLVGIENCSCVPIRAMKEDNSSLCELHNKLFNLAGDLSGGDLKDTGVFKQTVGRDEIQAHRKFLTDLKFINFAKHIFACNELPRVFDTTDGFWDKWVLLEFPFKFESQKEIDLIPMEMREKVKLKDPEIIDKITSPVEMSGLLNKAIDGLHRLLDNKNFSQTKGSRDIKNFWIRNSDSFAAFCIDRLEEDNESMITKRELRKMYHRYCKGHKLKGSSDKAIKVALEDRFGVIEGRKNMDGEFLPVWEGIKFKATL